MSDIARCPVPGRLERCPSPPPGSPGITVERSPSLHEWKNLALVRWASQGQRAETIRFREQLGLPTDAPIIATGHQPTMWHAGILAKYLAAGIVADDINAHALWLVADQDAVDPFEVRFPALDSSGALIESTLRLGPKPPMQAAAASLAPSSSFDAPHPQFPLDSVRSGIGRITSAYRAHQDASNASEQAGLVTADLLRDLGLNGSLLFATNLNRTDLFRSMLDTMRRDPDRAVLTYNAAAAQRPNAGVAPLEYSEVNQRHELPLWRLRPGAPRQRIFEEDLDAIPVEELAPRALLMTALLRKAGCELFIHGSGGALYDEVTELWINDWLGETLAPATLMTATLRLPLDDDSPTEDEVDRAVWMAHHAKHDPSLLGDHAAAQRKQEQVRRIAQLREQGADPGPEFRSMQDELRRYRAAQAERLSELTQGAEDLKRRADRRAIALDRTWPFALHDRAALEALREAIERDEG